MRKQSKVDAFFKRNNDEIQASNEPSNSFVETDQLNSKYYLAKSFRNEIKEGFDMNMLERDPRLR